MATRRKFLDIILPILIALIVFITALAINDAVVATINKYALKTVDIPSSSVTYKWIFAIISFVLLVIIVFIAFRLDPFIYSKN